MLKTTTSVLVRASVTVAAIGGFAMMILTANCGGSGSQRAGTGGTGVQGVGASGRGGASPLVCPATQLLDCANPVTLPDGHVTDWSASEWSNGSGKYCNASGLRGAIYSYHGVDDTLAQNAKVEGQALVLSLMVAASDYAGGGMAFDRCVNASSFNALQFTIAASSGDITGCDWAVALKTFEQQASTSPPLGGCDQSVTTCYDFPKAVGPVVPTATPQTVTIPFADLMPAAVGLPAPQQVVGLQWQVSSGAPLDPDGGLQLPCTVTLRIDDIKFVTQ